MDVRKYRKTYVPFWKTVRLRKVDNPRDATSMSGIAVTAPVFPFTSDTLTEEEESATVAKSKSSRNSTVCSGRKVSPAVRVSGIGFRRTRALAGRCAKKGSLTTESPPLKNSSDTPRTVSPFSVILGKIATPSRAVAWPPDSTSPVKLVGNIRAVTIPLEFIRLRPASSNSTDGETGSRWVI